MRHLEHEVQVGLVPGSENPRVLAVVTRHGAAT